MSRQELNNHLQKNYIIHYVIDMFRNCPKLLVIKCSVLWNCKIVSQKIRLDECRDNIVWHTIHDSLHSIILHVVFISIQSNAFSFETSSYRQCVKYLSLSYRNKLTGNDCTGQIRLLLSPKWTRTLLNSSDWLTFGASDATGSV